ncbi:MAG: sulfotransferase [Antarcticimicrobium sp.]|uniref:sulfotransferase n=1 Tax=Antarcticimicrobium sp. TaxID=2824147 RepID=UPI0026270EF6|nr:sulfotransferase [Antarcticimicrobium sp.]MDF1716022.1 sulfotransferase [Antarcticimicrobium sp.]
MIIPDLLLCVGAQKSGTTWLYNRLADHDQTRQGSHKELHYFTTVHCGGMLGPQMKINVMKRMMERHPRRVAKFIQAQATGEKPPRDIARLFRPMNDNWYAGIFQGAGRYAMDFSPEYAMLPDAGHDHIKRISERQKVIFIMREPLDRALSAVRYVFKRGGGDITTATEEEILTVARRPVIRDLSRYDTTVATLERNYAPENLRFEIYETMMADKAGTLNGICDWLDIARLDLPAAELERRDNATDAFGLPAVVVDELRQALAPVRAAIEDRFPQARAAWADVTARQEAGA